MSRMNVNRIRVLYFAALKERLGLAEEEIELDENVQTAADLLIYLKKRHGKRASAFDLKLGCAVDQSMSRWSDPIGQAREVALFPPMTGG